MGLILFIQTLRNCFDLKSPSKRKEFWNFQLFVFLTQFLLALTFILLGTYSENTLLNNFLTFLLMVYILFLFLNSVTLGMRRLNDLGKSKFWILLMLVPLLGVIFYYFYLGFAKSKITDSNTKDLNKEIDKGFIEIK